MFKSIGQFAGRKWDRLTNYSGAQRLSKFALVLLFGLDLFVLGMLFNGMRDVSARIPYPESAISGECEQMTESFQKFNAHERADSLKKYVITRSKSELGEEGESPYALHTVKPLPACEQVHAKLLSYVANQALGDLFRQMDQLHQRMSAEESEIEGLKSSYDSALLEKAAGQKREDSILPAEASKIKGQIAQHNADLDSERALSLQLEQSIEQHELISDYRSFVDKLSYPAEFAEERARYERSRFWYPIKTLLAQVAFLLPLLLLTLFWNAKVLKSQNNPQILISSHLILVCLIPVFLRVVYFFYELLPHQLLGKLIDWLNQLNLGFLWQYVAIIGGIVACVIVIVIAQKTVFSPARLRAIRLRKVQCRECGEKLQSADQACCEFCGTRQLEDCRHCGKPHRALANFCRHCGSAQSVPKAE